MNTSLSTSFAPLVRFLGKYNATIFFTLIVLLISGAILVLFLATFPPVDTTIDTAETNVLINDSFDQGTIGKIQQLHQSDETSSSLVLPVPRSNPFVE